VLHVDALHIAASPGLLADQHDLVGCRVDTSDVQGHRGLVTVVKDDVVAQQGC